MSAKFVLSVGIAGVIAGVAIAKHLDIDAHGQNFGAAMNGAGKSLVLPASEHGRCQTDLWIGGTRFRGAVADSGATGYLTIGRNQAIQAGIETGRRFAWTYQSANGRGRYNEIRVRRVRIGDAVELSDVPVDVTAADQAQALIGIEILRELNFRVRAGGCELSWEPLAG
jgi:clan AA aspartic protease (TIGR02281 family)